MLFRSKEESEILAGNKNYLESNLNLINHNFTQNQRKPDVWYNFYQKIKEIKIINKRDLNSNETNDNINYEKIFKASNEKSPIVFILSPGADPLSDVQNLAVDEGFAGNKFKYLSLGQGM